MTSNRRRVYAAGFSASLALFYQPLMAEAITMYSDFEEVLVGLEDVVERHGAQLLVVLFPTRIQVSNSDWNLLVRAYSLDQNNFDLNYPNRLILKMCNEHNVRCTDVLSVLREREKNGDGGFYRGRGDMHFNEKGQQVVAEILSRSLPNLNHCVNGCLWPGVMSD